MMWDHGSASSLLFLLLRPPASGGGGGKPLQLPLLAWLAAASCLIFIVWRLLAGRPFIGSLRGKHVFITGGSSGIGLAIAKQALREGAHVTLMGRDAGRLEAAKEELGRARGVRGGGLERVEVEVGDVREAEDVRRAIGRAWGRRAVDVLVCSAGRASAKGDLLRGNLAELHDIVTTNLVGTLNTIHAALPLFKLRTHPSSSPASIVLIGSVCGLFPMYGHSVYTSTKYALRGLAEALRFELLPHNIKVNLVCPFFTKTSLLDEVHKDDANYEVRKWVNVYNKDSLVESPGLVARRTMYAIKSGDFLVSTNLIAFSLVTLGRGFTPADTWGMTLLEFIFFIPIRISSLIIIPIFKFVIMKGASNHNGDK